MVSDPPVAMVMLLAGGTRGDLSSRRISVSPGRQRGGSTAPTGAVGRPPAGPNCDPVPRPSASCDRGAGVSPGGPRRLQHEVPRRFAGAGRVTWLGFPL